MPLFVGGSLHGQNISVDHTDPDDARLPASYVDAATGGSWTLTSVDLKLPHPITGQPDQQYHHQVYMAPQLVADPSQAMAGLQDAVTRWWFTTTGVHSFLGDVAEHNGHSDTEGARMFFVSMCAQCGIGETSTPLAFETLRERAHWIDAHRQSNAGHDITWAEHLRRPAEPERTEHGS
jgi:hypothetical protein